MLGGEAVQCDENHPNGGPHDRRGQSEARQRRRHSAFDRVVDRNEAAEHQDERDQKGEVKRDPNLARGDHSGGRFGIIWSRRHRMRQVPDQPDDRARDGRAATDSVHQSLTNRRVRHAHRDSAFQSGALI